MLHFAREVLIPLAPAILLAFLLAPAARRLERWHLGRLASTLVVVAVGFAAIGVIGWLAASEAVSVAARLPEYRENLAGKIRELRRAPKGAIGKAAEAIQELEKELSELRREFAELRRELTGRRSPQPARDRDGPRPPTPPPPPDGQE